MIAEIETLGEVERITSAMVTAAVSALAVFVAETEDEEQAHQEEDWLYGEVLLAIATGRCEDPPACCAAALAARELPFDRWYA